MPDAILFNGGFFIPEILRQRVADVMEHWYGLGPRSSRIAIWISRLRSARRIILTSARPAQGLLVRGGLPRAYFIGLGGSDGDQLRDAVPGSARH